MFGTVTGGGFSDIIEAPTGTTNPSVSLAMIGFVRPLRFGVAHNRPEFNRLQRVLVPNRYYFTTLFAKNVLARWRLRGSGGRIIACTPLTRPKASLSLLFRLGCIGRPGVPLTLYPRPENAREGRFRHKKRHCAWNSAETSGARDVLGLKSPSPP